MSKTDFHKTLPIDFNSPFFELHFGKKKDRVMTYIEFGEFLRNLHEQYVIQAFRVADKNGTGYISVGAFRDIIITLKRHLLTPDVASHLLEVI